MAGFATVNVQILKSISEESKSLKCATCNFATLESIQYNDSLCHYLKAYSLEGKVIIVEHPI